MGQKQSKEGTDNLSAQDVENDINILRRLAENEGSKAMTQYINESLNRWKKEQVKLAITGRAATGKSTFINKIRNLKPGDDDFAQTGSGDTTTKPTVYIHPKNDQITFYDLPGYSTTTFKKEEYIRAMNISDYDLIFVFFNNVLSEDEVWLIGELHKLGKPFSLVRSKIDIDIDNAKHDGKDQQMIIPEIKKKIKIALQTNPALKDTKGIFLISSRNTDLGEWSELMAYVEDNINGLKAQALLFSLDFTTKQILERKHETLKKRLVLATALAAAVAAIPVQGVDDVINGVGLSIEVNHYMYVFGVEPARISTLKDFDHSLLKYRSLLKPEFAMKQVVGTLFQKYGSHAIARSPLDLILPVVGSVISSVTTAITAYTFLSGALQDIKDDAVLIYGHINTINADTRI